jgi:NTP pyrophosphatase (non-canonical NTP hydrolase)
MNQEKDLFFTKIDRAVQFSKTTHNQWDLYSSILKLDEEFGELSEVILVVGGQLSHKTLKEKALGEIADNIIQCCCIASYNSDIDFYLNDIKHNYFVQFQSLVNELNAVKEQSLKDLLYFYHKKYRNSKTTLISGVDVASLECFRESLFGLVVMGVILTAMEENKEANDISLEYCSNTVNILLEQMEFKLNKWNKIHTKHVEG